MGTKKMASVADALFTRSQQKVLGVLFGQPDRHFFLNELNRITGAGKGALQRELARLEIAGLVVVEKQGNQKRFQVNRSAVVFEDLRRLVLKTFGMSQVLRDALAPISERIDGAFVFGSVAKGEDRAESDVDVIVWSDDLGYGEAIAALEPAETVLGRKINPAIYSQSEWSRKLAEDNAFVSRVAAGPKIWLIGTDK